MIKSVSYDCVQSIRGFVINNNYEVWMIVVVVIYVVLYVGVLFGWKVSANGALSLLGLVEIVVIIIKCVLIGFSGRKREYKK